MKKFSLILFSLILILSLFSCKDNDIKENNQTPEINENPSDDKPNNKDEENFESYLNIEKVENIQDDFILGVDASSVISLEDANVKFYNHDNIEEDVFKILSDNGVNYIRVRVWNNPYNTNNNGYGGGNCDIQKALKIGIRATKYNMKLLVNFHYSDFWADPGKQMVPKAWFNLNFNEKKSALYKFTKDSLQLLKKHNVDVGMVQIGNETNGSLCGETTWNNITELMNEGIKASKEVFPNCLTAIHFANPEKEGLYEYFAAELAKYNLNYDVFASSYYPYWHSTLDNLYNVLNNISKKYNKKVMVVENSYAYTTDDTDYYGNTIGSNFTSLDYPFTIEGQATQIRDVIDTVSKVENGIGYFYWEAPWISVGTLSYDNNKDKWEKYGCGWATSYASEYDPNDAGKYYGGNAVDNQALFDSNGKALESLKVFKLVKTGNVKYNKEMSDKMKYFDFNNNIHNGDTILTKYNGKDLVLIDLNEYNGPLTMQLLPYGGIQSVFNYNLIIHFKNGYFNPSKVIYNNEEMGVKEFIIKNDNLVNYVLG